MRLTGLILLGILLSTPCWADQPVQAETENTVLKPGQDGREELFDFWGHFDLDGNWGFNYSLKEFKSNVQGMPSKRLEVRGPAVKRKGRGFTPGFTLVFRF